MLTPEQLALLTETVQNAQQVVIAVAAPPEVARAVDRWGAAAALAATLTQLGKQVQFVAPAAPHLDKLPFPITELELVQSELGKSNLQISFPYRPEQVDKVSYHVDEERQQFSLIIQPQKGQAPLAAEQVAFEYMGTSADLIFIIGAKQFEDLDKIYWGHETFYANTRKIALAMHDTKLGDINIDGSVASGLCEVVARLLLHWQQLTPDTATTVLAGIEEQTQGFQSLSVTADTLELASQLMRAGARRVRRHSVPAAPRALNMTSSPDFAAALTKNSFAKNQMDKPRPTAAPKKKKPSLEPDAGAVFEPNAARK